jgi:exosome complex RNA-binding protein Rrp42 (RNase PH superfamily)
MAKPTLSQSECDFIRGGCRDNCRADGRTRHEYRTFTIATNVVPLSHGSSRVRSGSDDEIHYVASVKAEIVAPSLQQQRPNNDGCIEIALVHDALGNNSSSDSSLSHSVSLELRRAQSALQERVPWLPDRSASLCIVPHVAVWKLYVDVYIVSPLIGSGSVNLEAATHCINAALSDTVLPKVTVPNNDGWNDPDSNALIDNKAGGSLVAQASESDASTSFLDRLVVDSDLAHATRLVSSPHDLPLLVTLCSVVVAPSCASAAEETNQMESDRYRTQPPPVERLWLWDATAAEQGVATSAVHVVLTRRRRGRPLSSSSATATAATVPTATLDQQPEWDVVSVWKTGAKSLPLAALPECLALAQQAAPVVLQHYQYTSSKAQQQDNATTTQPRPSLGWFSPTLTIHS